MKKFVVIYHAPAEAMAAMATVSPEDKAKGMEAWMAWKAKNDNHVVDFGAPLMGGQTLNGNGDWSGSSREVSGYSIIQGTSVEEVKGIFSDHPHLHWTDGCSIEVHECVEM